MGMQPHAINGQPAAAPLAEHKAWSAPGVLALVAGAVALCVGIGLLISTLTSSAGNGPAGGWATILLVAGGLVLTGQVGAMRRPGRPPRASTPD